MEEREAGPTSVPGSNTGGRQRWRRRRRGSDTCVARARRAVGSAAGRLRTLAQGAGQLSGEPRAAECGEEGPGERVGWGGGREETAATRACPAPSATAPGRQQRTPAPRAAAQVTGVAAGNAAARGRGPRGRSEELTKEDGPLACGEAESPGDSSRKAAPLLHAAVSYSAPTHPPVVLRLWARHWGSLCPSHSPTAGPLQRQGSKMIL